MSGIVDWQARRDGVVVLTIDDPARGANTMSAEFVAELGEAVARLEAEREEIAGVVLASAKPTFFAGGDLDWLIRARAEDAAEVTAFVTEVKSHLRRLELLGRPVVAAIAGSALGGGLELCLAAHHRVAVRSDRIRLGFPEVTLGLLPGAGGITRSVRMLGIVPALTKLLLQGRQYGPEEGLGLGIVDELVDDQAALLDAAAAWIAANPEPSQPWDRPGYRIPGGTPLEPELLKQLPALPANLRKQLRGARYPAPPNIMAAAVEGAQVDFETAQAIEGRYFVDLVVGQISKNMTKALFYDMREVTDRAGGAGEPGVEKAVVLGAGMMGAGIAYVCAKAGMEVVLKDVSVEAAEQGKSRSERLLAKQVERGKLTEEGASELLGRIVATDDVARASGADLVIEAVVEDPAVKAEALAEVEPLLASGATIGSNTSTIPITGLAAGVARPEAFIGTHFFSPVDKMRLIELIRGERTSEETLRRSLGIASRLGKVPIVVKDSRGFFTSRVIGSFLNEGIAMLLEGIPAPTIEQASEQAGYPAPVLQLCDELNLGLMRSIRQAAEAAGETGSGFDNHPATVAIDRMLDEFDRPGRLAGRGFYEYADGVRGRLWSGLAEAFPPVEDPAAIALVDLEERMLFSESLTAARCLEEGVIESAAEANVGSILGIGFPAWTGGVMQLIEGYEGGAAGFVARSRELAQRYGERFEPPPGLLARAGGE